MLVYTFINKIQYEQPGKNFQTNSSTHNINTSNEHVFTNQVLVFKKRAFYVGIKIFNTFPRSLKILKNEKQNLKES
jgi:hypothetical protein